MAHGGWPLVGGIIGGYGRGHDRGHSRRTMVGRGHGRRGHGRWAMIEGAW